MNKRLKRLVVVLSVVATLVVSFGMNMTSAVAKTTAKISCKQQTHQVTVVTVQYKAAVRNVNKAKAEHLPNQKDAKLAVKKTKTKLSKAKKRAATCAKQAKAAAKKKAQKAAAKTENITVDPTSLSSLFTGEVHPDEVAFGNDAQPLLNGAPEERGAAAFTQKTLKSPAEVSAWLNSPGDVRATATKDRVVKAIHDAGYGDDQVQRALNGQGWFLMVIKPESQVLGTTYFVDGQAVDSVNWRQTGVNDAYWLFVASDGKVIAGASVRADCGNARIVKIQIVRPGVTPPAPSVPTPPIPGEKPALSFDCQQNGIGCPPGVNPAWVQPVQDNTFAGVNIGPTPGATTAPTQSVQGPTPVEGTPALAPTPAPGYTAPVAPGGTTTNPDGTTSGGGPVPPSTTVPVDTGDHTTDPGGF